MKNLLFPLWVIIDVLLVIASISLWIAAPEFKTLNMSIMVFALSLACLLAFMRMSYLKIYVKSAYFKTVLYHVINVFLVASILGVINYLGNKNFKEFDITIQQRNSLTDQSLKVLEIVKTPLKFTVYSRREDWGGILNVLKLYRAANQNIQTEAIDTDVRPDLVKEKNISQNGTVIISYKNKETIFTITDELSVTNALLKALRDSQINLYFTTGHQELRCDDKTNEGISNLCEKLETQNYHIKNLDLALADIPKDATAIFILGPTSGFLPEETKKLQSYLAAGGSVFLALAPSFKVAMYDNLNNLAKPFGLSLGKDIVIDRLSTIQGAEATIPIVSKYSPDHAITAGFNLRTVFPLSASVNTIEGNDSAELLAFTSDFPGSWAETDLKAVTTGRADYKEGIDQKGPIGLLGIGEQVGDGARGSRFILLGSSSFLINAYQGQAGNTTLFLNSVSWMVDDEGIISFNRPGIEEYPVILSANHLQMIFVISILFVPIIFFGAAIFIYRRRRLL